MKKSPVLTNADYLNCGSGNNMDFGEDQFEARFFKHQVERGHTDLMAAPG